MSQPDGSFQAACKVVCSFCGSQQFQNDRCTGCGGASLEVIDSPVPPAIQLHTAVLDQSLKTQSHMNVIAILLTVGLIIVIFSTFMPSIFSLSKTTTTPVAIDTTVQTKEYILLEVPTQPLKVVYPQFSLPRMELDDTAKRKTAKKNKKANLPDECKFDELEPSDDFAVFAWRGTGKKLDYQINGQGKTATQVDIIVNQTKRGVVLMLDAYMPTIWNIKRTEGTEIKAIFFNGDNRQVLAGLDDSLPIFANTPQNGYPCGRFLIRNDINKVNQVSMALFGAEVKAFGSRTGVNGEVRFGAPTSYTQMIISSGVSPSSYRDSTQPLAGQAGINEAVAKGIIRPATRADMDRWIRRAERNSYPSDKLKQVQDYFQYNAYLVVKPLIYPAALNGSNSVNFFIDRGVPLPTGDPGHSGVFDINSGTCLSITCRITLTRR